MAEKLPEKPIGEYTEEEIKQMWLELFFWVVDHRRDWLMEAIEKRKAMHIAEQLRVD